MGVFGENRPDAQAEQQDETEQQRNCELLATTCRSDIESEVDGERGDRPDHASAARKFGDTAR
ncbi:MAG: hypothetical protein ACJ76Z_14485 [Thermoleophilaceae bacterium]